MGIDNIELLFPEPHLQGERMNETAEAPENDEEASAPEAKPVDDPNLPDDGDPEAKDLEPEPVDEADFGDDGEADEEAEQPNDLSGVDKEFDDDEPGTDIPPEEETAAEAAAREARDK